MTKAIERETVKVTTVLGEGVVEGHTTEHEGVAVLTGVLVQTEDKHGVHVVMQGRTNFSELLTVLESMMENVISSAIDDQAGELPEVIKIPLKLSLLAKLAENVADELTKDGSQVEEDLTR